MRNPHGSLKSLFLTAALLAGNVCAQFAPGNLVVVRVGDGSGPLVSGVAVATFLDEYDPTGALVQSVPLPTTAAGGNRAFVNSGSATSEGHLNLSSDCRYLIVAGYDAAPGTVGIAATASATVARVIARADVQVGTIDTSTTITNAYSANNIRSAASDDGQRFWVAGANSGIGIVALGGSTTTALTTGLPTNNRVVTIQGGQLWSSAASGAFQGVSAVGSGVPTTAPQTIALLPGFPTTSGPSAYDHFFADAATLYVADDRTNGSGGIQKWTFDGITWTLQYTLSPNATTGCRGLTGTVGGGVATLFATANGTDIVRVVDLGAGSPFTTLASAGANTALRGIRLLPGSVVRQAHACGTATIDATGSPTIGNTLTTTLGGVGQVAFVGLDFTVVATPFCGGCTLGHLWSIANFGSSFGLTVPANPAFIGAVVGIQGADFFAAGGCASPAVALTDTLVVTVGGCR